MPGQKLTKFAALCLFICSARIATAERLASPQNAYEAEIAADYVVASSSVAAAQRGLSLADMEFVITVETLADGKPLEIFAADIAHRGLKVRFEIGSVASQGESLVDDLDHETPRLVTDVVAEFFAPGSSEGPLRSFAPSKKTFADKLTAALKTNYASLRALLGQRRHVVYRLVKPFFDSDTGITQPRSRIFNDLRLAVPIILISTFTTFISVIANTLPTQHQSIGECLEAFRMWNIYFNHFHRTFQVSPYIGPIAAMLLQTFWGLYNRAGNTIASQGRNFSVVTNKLGINSISQIFAQFHLSFWGNLMVFASAYSHTMFFGEFRPFGAYGPYGTAFLWSSLPHIGLNSLFGAFAKKLPQKILVELQTENGGPLGYTEWTMLSSGFNLIWTFLKFGSLLQFGFGVDAVFWGLAVAGVSDDLARRYFLRGRSYGEYLAPLFRCETELSKGI